MSWQPVACIAAKKRQRADAVLALFLRRVRHRFASAGHLRRETPRPFIATTARYCRQAAAHLYPYAPPLGRDAGSGGVVRNVAHCAINRRAVGLAPSANRRGRSLRTGNNPGASRSNTSRPLAARRRPGLLLLAPARHTGPATRGRRPAQAHKRSSPGSSRDNTGTDSQRQNPGQNRPRLTLRSNHRDSSRRGISRGNNRRHDSHRLPSPAAAVVVATGHGCAARAQGRRQHQQ